MKLIMKEFEFDINYGRNRIVIDVKNKNYSKMILVEQDDVKVFNNGQTENIKS